MERVFLACSILGGTVFVLQFVLAVIGFGAEDFDIADDVPDDVDFGDVGDEQGHVTDHGSTWLFGIISFRTVVAALTFFGLTGYAALQADQSQPMALMIAIACGGAAMYGVHWLMQLLYRLSQDRTVRIERAVGRRGTVYIPIPGAGSGTGKVQLSVQERLVEYAATTTEPDQLPTGAKIVVTRIIGPATVEVELIPEAVGSTDA